MKMDIHEKQFTSDVVAKAAGCVEGTLRQWRNRHGFLSETFTGGMEVKYFSVLDVCVVRAVTVLARYMPARHAIWFADGHVRLQLDRLLQGKPKTSSRIGFFLRESGGEPTFSSDPGDTAEELLADTEGVIVLVDLNTAVIDRVFKVLKLGSPKRG
jgi:prepilin-type processing-associated H-X9-DG protein